MNTHTVANEAKQIDEITARYSTAREVKEQAEQEFREIQAELIEAIRSTGDKKVESRGMVWTVVTAERTKVDADKLRELVPAAVFDEIADYSVLPRKLAAAIASGAVDAEVVAPAVEISLASPYVSVASAPEV